MRLTSRLRLSGSIDNQVILMERAPLRSSGLRLRSLASISLHIPAHAPLTFERPRPVVLHFAFFIRVIRLIRGFSALAVRH
jgi:hypothetical protein